LKNLHDNVTMILSDKSDPKYFHSVEPQNRLRLPHTAKI